ncbi:MAG: hypothetical protein WCJ84_05145 [Candidatus Peregrinibacteria bacterium]
MSLSLSELLANEVSEWRDKGYVSEFAEISEILSFQKQEDSSFRFLRKAQFLAIEVYLYLRVIKNTPHIFDVYQEYYTGKDLLDVLGVSYKQEEVMKIMGDSGASGILEKIKTDDSFVKKYSLEATREMMTLEYPSYILALAMGAGKTTLIGAIIAIEFALAMETGDDRFLKNALVFAPGNTIFRALREVQAIPFEKILPLRLYKKFIQNLKFVVASEAKELPLIEGNNFYVVITNTEKIRIQKRTLRGKKNQISILTEKQEAEVISEANLRLQKIAFLKNLGIFSDEAHGLYGQNMGEDLKKVRQTVNYLANESDVKVVVNTTGTPYFEKQMLKEVIYWYGISEGIEDGILKSVKNSIRAYRNVTDEGFVQEVISDFFTEYGTVQTPQGIPAKIALYFPNTDDLKTLRPIIEQAVIQSGYDASLVTECHSKAPKEAKNAFDNFHRKESPHRVILLVGMGTEGWDCPALFACALAREIKGSNNLTLQASTRCMRQIVGNTKPARIYLSEKNIKPLDRQLQETYGKSLDDLIQVKTGKTKKIILRKTHIPSLFFEVERVFVKEKEGILKNISITLVPFLRGKEMFETVIFDSTVDHEKKGKLQEKEVIQKEVQKMRFSLPEGANIVARKYALPFFPLLAEMKKLHNDLDFTAQELEIIGEQIESLFGERWDTEVKRERQELVLLKKEGFLQDSEGNYYAEIRYTDENRLLEHKGEEMGFHYSPYNFDSQDEKAFFEWLLEQIGEESKNIEDVYFTGAITTPEKTDFWFWYKGVDNLWHRYTPDFLIRKKDGKVCIVEIKPKDDEEMNAITQQKAKKLRRIAEINPHEVRFELIENFERLSESPAKGEVRKFLKS